MTDSSVKFKTYSGETIKVLGKALISVCYKSQTFILRLYITEGEKPNLSGRDWLSNLQLNWNELFSMKEKQNENLEHLLDEFKEIFLNELGTMNNEKAKIYLKPNSMPKFLKARPVPYVLKQRIEIELETMVKSGVLEPVDMSYRATPIVPVIKDDGSIRICGD